MKRKFAHRNRNERNVKRKTGQSYVCLYLNDMQDIVVNIRRSIFTTDIHIHIFTLIFMVRSLSIDMLRAHSYNKHE